MTQNARKVYAVDIDGVLCVQGPFKEYQLAIPILPNIEKVNALWDEGNVIILHTSRLEEDRAATEHWMKKYKVKYTAIVFGKLRADVYVDDKNGTL